ncbi:ion transporter [Planctomycetota bacterium]
MTLEGKRRFLARIIFGTDTRAGRLYDIVLIVLIVLSAVVAMLDSAKTDSALPNPLTQVEWCLTILFTLDYITRLACAPQPWRYARSFFGVIDLLSVIPTYFTLLGPGTDFNYLATIRFLRVLRLFRVLNLSTYQVELQRLWQALAASARRIMAFILFVITTVVVLGALVYSIEKDTPGFDNIPHSIYWAVVTLTTVGYGDISPETGLGRVVAALIMILGYSIIVIPTGIVAAAVPHTPKRQDDRSCDHCQSQGHDTDAFYCKFCGHELDP